jgi:hypothetical protein
LRIVKICQPGAAKTRISVGDQTDWSVGDAAAAAAWAGVILLGKLMLFFVGSGEEEKFILGRRDEVVG